MTTPQWSEVDDDTGSLLSLVAEPNPGIQAELEWAEYVAALRFVAGLDGIIRPNSLRPLLRGVVKPQRVGAFAHRALTSGLVAYTGEWEVSDDTTGRNGGKPAREMRWLP